MSSYVTFVNKSAYPAVSVYYDGFPIDDMILKNASSEEYAPADRRDRGEDRAHPKRVSDDEPGICAGASGDQRKLR